MNEDSSLPVMINLGDVCTKLNPHYCSSDKYLNLVVRRIYSLNRSLNFKAVHSTINHRIDFYFYHCTNWLSLHTEIRCDFSFCFSCYFGYV